MSKPPEFTHYRYCRGVLESERRERDSYGDDPYLRLQYQYIYCRYWSDETRS